MIIVMETHAPKEQIDRVVAEITRMGVHAAPVGGAVQDDHRRGGRGRGAG